MIAMTALAIEQVLKQCPMCQASWADLRALVEDRSLRVVGYMACFDDVDCGLVLLTHQTVTCGTTIVVPARVLRPLYHGPQIDIHATLSAQCPRLCTRRQDFEVCTVPCDMAWVREAMQVLRKHEWPLCMPR